MKDELVHRWIGRVLSPEEFYRRRLRWSAIFGLSTVAILAGLLAFFSADSRSDQNLAAVFTALAFIPLFLSLWPTFVDSYWIQFGIVTAPGQAERWLDDGLLEEHVTSMLLEDGIGIEDKHQDYEGLRFYLERDLWVKFELDTSMYGTAVMVRMGGIGRRNIRRAQALQRTLDRLDLGPDHEALHQRFLGRLVQILRSGIWERRWTPRRPKSF